MNRALKPKRCRAYESWKAMKERCLNQNHVHFNQYGGRGITICDRWLKSFDNFLEDMGDRPEGKTLDRYPNKDGNYEPDNCRWATPREQANNRETCRMLSHNGQTKTLTEWARFMGMTRGALKERIRKGWSIEAALGKPIGGGRKLSEAQVSEILSSPETHASLSRRFNVTPEAIAYVRKGGRKGRK